MQGEWLSDYHFYGQSQANTLHPLIFSALQFPSEEFLLLTFGNLIVTISLL